MKRGVWLLGLCSALAGCQSLEGLLGIYHAPPPRVTLGVLTSPTPLPTATPTPQPPTETATPEVAAPSPAPLPTATAGEAASPEPSQSPAPSPSAPASAAPSATPTPTAKPSPTQPETCGRVLEAHDYGQEIHGRFKGYKLPRGWATAYSSENQVLGGIDRVYQTDWACFQQFYPEAAQIYRNARGRR